MIQGEAPWIQGPRPRRRPSAWRTALGRKLPRNFKEQATLGRQTTSRPYRRREAHHEDQLTRAFLILLRHVPMAHAAWLALLNTSRMAMNVCPGITMRKIWDLEEADELDAQGELPSLVRQHVEGAGVVGR